ncbi:MAG: phosphodiesterase [Holdemanella sp.]|nr:phosphodiesterase [Holdemanella sp.]
MKYLVASDVHGSLFYVNQFIKRIETEKPDKIILLGDLYYHGPRNPLPRDYNPKEVCTILNRYKDQLIVIKGNCDAEVDEMISDFTFHDSFVLNQSIFFTHGHHINIDHPIKGYDMIIYGHFHIPFIKEKENQIFINPGSISLPKENSYHGYLVLEDNNIELKDLDGNIHIKKKI